ncbi:MAG: signal peptidase II [Rickettsiales bacterium]|nr:signal peptidase II [Rickettsiales bacterium]
MTFWQKHSFTLGLVVALAVMLADQASKWLIVSRVITPEAPVVEVLPFFRLVMVWNHGISFGMFAGAKQPLPLIGLSLLIVGVLLVWLHRNASVLVSLALGSIIGGAVGNMADRLHYGAVVDFLDVSLGSYHWPAFNLADSAIFIGVVLLSLSSMFMEPPRSKETS